MKHFFPGILLLMLASCGSPPGSNHSPAAAPVLGFHRKQDQVFSPQERKIIAAAQHHLSLSNKRPSDASDDAFYRVRTNTNGYEVFVIYVTGYNGRQPVFTPCVHNEVVLGRDGSLVQILSGPECWPSLPKKSFVDKPVNY